MKIDPGRTLSQLATELPALLPVFDKYGLDYCCGGNRTLEVAAAERGIPLADILAELEAAASGPPPSGEREWEAAKASEIIAHILDRYHKRLREELPRLDALLARVLHTHGSGHGAVLGPLSETFRSLREELEGHMHKEEKVLFPYLLEVEGAVAHRGTGLSAAPGFASGAIGVMEREHESAALALLGMRRLTGEYSPPPDACPSFRALYEGLSALETDLKRHIHLENNILFPKAVEMESRLIQEL